MSSHHLCGVTNSHKLILKPITIEILCNLITSLHPVVLALHAAAPKLTLLGRAIYHRGWNMRRIGLSRREIGLWYYQKLILLFIFEDAGLVGRVESPFGGAWHVGGCSEGQRFVCVQPSDRSNEYPVFFHLAGRCPYGHETIIDRAGQDSGRSDVTCGGQRACISLPSRDCWFC
jgi:hypothetical protein